MRNDWKEFTLDEIYEFRSGLSKPRSEFGSGSGFLSFKDVFYNFFVPEELSELVNSSEKEQEGCSIKRGDVFLTRTSETFDELGMSCVALKDYEKATFNGFSKRLRPIKENMVIPEYAGYYFRNPYFRNSVTAMSSMSTRASLNNEMLSKLKIILPSIEEQISIGHILQTLDDKIELNRQMNQSLEQMAQALFKSWFVDEQWESEVELGDVVETTSGGTPSRKQQEFYKNGNIPWVKSKELNSSFILSTEEHITEDAINKSSAKILPSKSILIAMYGATVGEYSILSKEMACNQAICALKPNEKYPFPFLFMFVRNKKEYLVNLAIGSAQQNISQALIKRLAIPSCYEKIKLYSSIVEPYFEKIYSNLEEIETLTNLRDTLLPKLISGEVRVSEEMLSQFTNK